MAGTISLDGQYDYVIVGAGTAGCVLAARLSEDPSVRVLLLEAGGSDRYHWVQIPVGYLYCIGNPRTDWMMRTAPEAGLNGRSLAYPRGKVLGGCTSVNGMIYMRGQAADYDGWRELGNEGWGWSDVLPFFKRSEDYHGPQGEMHSTGGPWKVSRQRLKWKILEAVQAGAGELGIKPRADFNDGDNEGSGFFDVNQHKGVRWNTARGFLRPALKRPNLRVIKHALVERLTMDGNRVTGVEYRASAGFFHVKASSEVILAAGAINSPKLLELSGIGDPERLRSLGIEVNLPRPAVGENLQDHLQIRTVFKVKNTVTLNQLANSWRGKIKIAAEYALMRSGPMSMAPSQFGMFTRSTPGANRPDIEYHVQPLSTGKLGDPLHSFPAITVSVCQLRPSSVGTCHITSTDPDRQPEIRPNYLSTDHDRSVAIAAIRQARQVMATDALRPYEPNELLPGTQFQDDDELLKKAGDIATTIFHPVGTCRMGVDADAVVDPALRVKGVQRLRIVDASIMPRIVSGNTASPVVMIAEKAAAMMRMERKSGH